ncbi:hypothetical protein M758_UG277600 [Ceratodon purpureus]|nr:hypothetical protein M758_UG277600 [Ceratodon purpureus]
MSSDVDNDYDEVLVILSNHLQYSVDKLRSPSHNTLAHNPNKISHDQLPKRQHLTVNLSKHGHPSNYTCDLQLLLGSLKVFMKMCDSMTVLQPPMWPLTYRTRSKDFSSTHIRRTLNLNLETYRVPSTSAVVSG